MIACEKIILYVMDIVSTNLANNLLANSTSTILKNSDDKNVRYKMDCYILDTVLLVIILLFNIAIICYYYTRHRSNKKSVGALTT